MLPLRTAGICRGPILLVASLCHNRRKIDKDYQGLCAMGEAFAYVAMAWHMVKRLAYHPKAFRAV